MKVFPIKALSVLFVLYLFIGPIQDSFAQKAPEKLSPFTAVRWDGKDPVVRFDGEWYVFASLNGISKTDILQHAKKRHGSRWQKRFSEDLVQLLVEMGYKPEINVELTLIKDDQIHSKKGVMTVANRRKVWQYNQNQ